MAFTKSVDFTTVIGNKRAIGLTITADANSGAVETGLSVIEHVQATVISAATGSQKFKKNLNSGLTANNGSLMMSSCTNGDAFHVLCIGR
jgi:hypothetical protein